MEIGPDFFHIFIQVALELFYLATAMMYFYWLEPFIIRKKSVYAAAFAYWLISFFGRNVDSVPAVGRLLSVLSIALPALLLFYLDEKRNPLQKVFICLIFPLIWWLILEIFSEIGFYERDFILELDFVKKSTAAIILDFVAWNLFYYIGAGFVLYGSFRLLHKTYKYKHDELSWQEFIMLLTPAITLLVVKSIVRSYFDLWMNGIENGSITTNIPGNVFRIAFCVLSYISILIILIFYQQIKDAEEERHIRYVLNSQTEELTQHMEQVREMYEQMRAMRHDIGNHLSIVEGLLETGGKQEASAYIEEWKTQFSDISPRIKTRNAITDVALSEFARRFCKEGIPFECSFVYPDTLSINEFDLCVVLTNSLQNAFEASTKMENPRVAIASATRGNILIINVKNLITQTVSIDPDSSLPLSSKKEGGHGYGLKNIRAVARKYKGEIEIRQEADVCQGYWFILNIMLSS